MFNYLTPAENLFVAVFGGRIGRRHQRSIEEKDKLVLVWSAVLDMLDRQERRIIQLSYGIPDGQVWELRAIGEEVGFLPESVKYYEFKAIARLASFDLAEKFYKEASVHNLIEDARTVSFNLRTAFAERLKEFRFFREVLPSSHDNKKISDLNLSVRGWKACRQFEIETVGELRQARAKDLLLAKNFGKTSLNEVRDKLREMGLKLRDDD